MLTRGTKSGLVLAFLLGLADISILGALADDEKPPLAIVVISVAIGALTCLLVVRAWRSISRALVVGIVALRGISALGDVLAFGEDAEIVIMSMALLVVSLVDFYLLRGWLRSRTAHPALT